MVLNLVAHQLLQWQTEEDRVDIMGWLTCTTDEAVAFQRESAAEDLARQKRLLGTIGTVG